MRVINGEYDVIRVLASEMLNVEISRYLFYKGRVINWAHSAMSKLHDAMMISSEYLDIDMFIKYSLPITVDNIEQQYNNAPLYPIYKDGECNSNSIAVHVSKSIKRDYDQYIYAVNIPFMYNLYKLVKEVTIELQSYPIFKLNAYFNKKTGEIQNIYVSNDTVVISRNSDKCNERYYTETRIINVDNPNQIHASIKQVVQDKDLMNPPYKAHQTKGGVWMHHIWYFNITQTSGYYDNCYNYNIYIDYLNIYKGLHFAKYVKDVSNIMLFKYNLDFLLPSLYAELHINNIELLNDQDANNGMILYNYGLSGIDYTHCVGNCMTRSRKVSVPPIHIGIIDIVKKQCYCIRCYYFYFEDDKNTKDKCDTTNLRLFYNMPELISYATDQYNNTISYKGSDVTSSNKRELIHYLLLTTLLSDDVQIDYTKKKGTIVRVAITSNDRYDYIVLFNDPRDLADIELTDNTQLVYANKDFINLDDAFDDSILDCNFQKI